jgi:hypothetical protein
MRRRKAQPVEAVKVWAWVWEARKVSRLPGYLPPGDARLVWLLLFKHYQSQVT